MGKVRGKSDPLCIVLVAVGTLREARKIARALLTAKLAACVNIVPRIESHYWWKGRIDTAGEYLLVIKSARRHFRNLCVVVKKAHSYETPEIVAIPIDAAESCYGAWWTGSMS